MSTKIQCSNPDCRHQWSLASAKTNRCPKCGWIVEIYSDKSEAQEVARIYNAHEPKIAQKARTSPLLGMDGHSVSFPSQDRLSDVADKLLMRKG